MEGDVRYLQERRVLRCISLSEMIFVPLGTQAMGFSRCLEMLDDMIRHYDIKEDVIVQMGNSIYQSDNFKTIPFLPEEEFAQYIAEASVVISHAGSGALFGAIKRHKKLIAVARLKKYHEMVDDHQTELVKKLSEGGYIIDGTYSLIDAWAKIEGFEPRENDFNCEIIPRLKQLIDGWMEYS